MPNRFVTAEITDGKENRITFAYAADTSTRPFTNNVQEWKEYGVTVNAEDASACLTGFHWIRYWKEYDINARQIVATTTHPFDAEAKSKKEYNCTAKTIGLLPEI